MTATTVETLAETTVTETPEATKLTGAELLAMVKEMDNASKTELVRAAGYVSLKKDGTERLNFTAFYEALLIAKGIDLGSHYDKVPGGRKGMAPSYTTTVHFNGNIMVGKTYTAQMGLKPGDRFQIRLGKNNNISLVPVGPADDSQGNVFDDNGNVY